MFQQQKTEAEQLIPEADKTAPHGTIGRWSWYAICAIAWNNDRDAWAKYVRDVVAVCVKASSENRPTCIFHGCAVVSRRVCYCAQCSGKNIVPQN